MRSQRCSWKGSFVIACYSLSLDPGAGWDVSLAHYTSHGVVDFLLPWRDLNDLKSESREVTMNSQYVMIIETRQY
ncbi:hypothetical protein F5Y15DRAFT_386934 [Xylariaceae sp. FL0016]|nr:hypothetical protein F5Y15DRAFT_386934 [Xylariaceae sp. FL0016]